VCHQTVRLVAEALERKGIATIVVATMRAALAGLPRVLITRFPMGQNFGPAGDSAEHAAVVRDTLAMLDVTEPTLRSHKPA
jgi:hypothetical protein